LRPFCRGVTDDSDHVVTSILDTTASTTAPPPLLSAPAEAVTMAGREDLGPPFGSRWNLATAWTGTELLLWGGDRSSLLSDSDGNPTSTGYACNPETVAWRQMARSELCPVGRARGVSTR
jgi:hypothetical protein